MGFQAAAHSLGYYDAVCEFEYLTAGEVVYGRRTPAELMEELGVAGGLLTLESGVLSLTAVCGGVPELRGRASAQASGAAAGHEGLADARDALCRDCCWTSPAVRTTSPNRKPGSRVFPSSRAGSSPSGEACDAPDRRAGVSRPSGLRRTAPPGPAGRGTAVTVRPLPAPLPRGPGRGRRRGLPYRTPGPGRRRRSALRGGAGACGAGRLGRHLLLRLQLCAARIARTRTSARRTPARS